MAARRQPFPFSEIYRRNEALITCRASGSPLSRSRRLNGTECFPGNARISGRSCRKDRKQRCHYTNLISGYYKNAVLSMILRDKSAGNPPVRCFLKRQKKQKPACTVNRQEGKRILQPGVHLNRTGLRSSRWRAVPPEPGKKKSAQQKLCGFGGNDRARTDDLLRVKQALSLLSYASKSQVLSHYISSQ